MSSTQKNLRPHRQISSATRKQLGRQAELSVADQLISQNWQILAHGYQVKHSEIDLIARKGRTVIFVEVKYRARPYRNRAMETLIHPRKIQALRFGAKSFISRRYRETGLTYRFDLAIVYGNGQIHYTPNFMTA